MNYCRECGNRLNENGDFCPNCGLKYKKIEETRVRVQKKTNGLSVAGMVLGIFSMIFSMWGVISILAIIFSSIARKQIAESGENGDGMAVAGLVCGVLSLTMLVLIWDITNCA